MKKNMKCKENNIRKQLENTKSKKRKGKIGKSSTKLSGGIKRIFRASLLSKRQGCSFLRGQNFFAWFLTKEHIFIFAELFYENFVKFLLKFEFFKKKNVQKTLKITIPENLNYQGAFDEILSNYTKKYSLIRIQTTDLGALFELWYTVIMDADVNEQEFINDLRCRNGNLNISLTISASIKIK